METLGFIGLGNLGRPMALNFQKTGYPMVIHDVREEAAKPLLDGGARLASSPTEVARLSDVTFTSVPGPKEVEEVAIGPQGVIHGIKEGGIYVDLSTSRPALIRQIEPMFREKGAHVLDAPVLSSPARAASRNLVVMVGGEREVFDRIHPILEAFSDKIVYTGGLGTGTICKLVNNMVSCGVRQIIAEGLTLGVKAGIELDTLMESGSREPLGMWRDRLEQSVFQGKFEPPTFSLALYHKDVNLATELGRDLDVPMPLMNQAFQTMIHAMNRGWAEKDSFVFFRLQEEKAGIEVRSS